MHFSLSFLPWLLTACAPAPLEGAPQDLETDDKSICGATATWVDVEDSTTANQDLARSVGRLILRASNETTDTAGECTGSLVAPSLFLTAGHCVDPAGYTGANTIQDVCDLLEVQFNYQEVNNAMPANADMPRFDCEEILSWEDTNNDDGTYQREHRQLATD